MLELTLRPALRAHTCSGDARARSLGVYYNANRCCASSFFSKYTVLNLTIDATGHDTLSGLCCEHRAISRIIRSALGPARVCSVVCVHDAGARSPLRLWSPAWRCETVVTRASRGHRQFRLKQGNPENGNAGPRDRTGPAPRTVGRPPAALTLTHTPDASRAARR